VESKARHFNAETKAINKNDIQVMEQQQSLVSGQSNAPLPTAQDIAIIQYGKNRLSFYFLISWQFFFLRRFFRDDVHKKLERKIDT
jgi:hypothetical protein